MRDFFENIPRYGGFFLFLLLELVCFILIVRYNQDQRTIFLHSSNLFAGFVNKKYTDSRDYLGLVRRVDSLRADNAALNERVANLRVSRISVVEDSSVISTDTSSEFDIIPARIINNSINRHHNYLTLDVGRLDQVDAHAGVVTSRGIVGIITHVSDHYARVMSVLHRQSRISASVKKNGFFGTLIWTDTDPQRLTLEDVPKHAEVTNGDTIVTSGHSAIFPPGIFIGKVESWKLEPGKNSYTIQVKLNEDIGRVRDVFVIRHLRRKELTELEQKSTNE